VGETIESVLSQEGDFEIEYSVMDGGSTDGSVDIIRRYADLVASGGWPVRCRGITMSWVSEGDAGQTAAINAGLRHATGDIYSYINSDDLYFRGAFQRVVEAFAGDPAADFVYGDGDVIDGRARSSGWRPYNRRHDLLSLLVERLHQLHHAAGDLLAPARP
jgi:glycosyltransferase involved in cell wall biosynthesis